MILIWDFFKKPMRLTGKVIDKPALSRYNDSCSAGDRRNEYGGVAQLVEPPVHTRSVIGSSPIAATRPVGQVVKTPPFHGGNMGSSPVRVTKKQSEHVS